MAARPGDGASLADAVRGPPRGSPGGPGGGGDPTPNGESARAHAARPGGVASGDLGGPCPGDLRCHPSPTPTWLGASPDRRGCGPPGRASRVPARSGRPRRRRSNRRTPCRAARGGATPTRPGARRPSSTRAWSRASTATRPSRAWRRAARCSCTWAPPPGCATGSRSTAWAGTAGRARGATPACRAAPATGPASCSPCPRRRTRPPASSGPAGASPTPFDVGADWVSGYYLAQLVLHQRARRGHRPLGALHRAPARGLHRQDARAGAREHVAVLQRLGRQEPLRQQERRRGAREPRLVRAALLGGPVPPARPRVPAGALPGARGLRPRLRHRR